MSLNRNTLEWKDAVDGTYEKIASIVGNKKAFVAFMKQRERVGWCFDYLLISRLYKVVRKKLEKENDYVIVICGREGSGKSTIGLQIGSFVDPLGFSVDKICFEPKEVIENWKKCGIGSAIQIDEGGLVLFSRQAMSRVGINMIKLFMTIRAKSFLHIICCPNYKDLDSYIKKHRVNMIIDVRERGYYQAYIGDSIRIVNEVMHKGIHTLSSIKVPEGTFWNGRFNLHIPEIVDMEAYSKKKHLHINALLDEAQTKLEGTKKEWYTVPEIVKKYNISSTTLYKYIKQELVKPMRLGNNWRFTDEMIIKVLKDRQEAATLDPVVVVKGIPMPPVPISSKNGRKDYLSMTRPPKPDQ